MKQIAKSIRQRLLNMAHQKQIDYNLLLIRYFHERFLYRLSISPYRNSFYLKGGALLYALETQFLRPTIDIDLLGIKIKNDQENLLKIFTEICKIEFLEDGIVFDFNSIKTVEINAIKKYQGIRISLLAYLDTIKQRLQIDVGFGDTKKEKGARRKEKAAGRRKTEEYPLQILKGCPKGGVVYMKMKKHLLKNR